MWSTPGLTPGHQCVIPVVLEYARLRLLLATRLEYQMNIWAATAAVRPIHRVRWLKSNGRRNRIWEVSTSVRGRTANSDLLLWWQTRATIRYLVKPARAH